MLIQVFHKLIHLETSLFIIQARHLCRNEFLQNCFLLILFGTPLWENLFFMSFLLRQVAHIYKTICGCNNKATANNKFYLHIQIFQRGNVISVMRSGSGYNAQHYYSPKNKVRLGVRDPICIVSELYIRSVLLQLEPGHLFRPQQKQEKNNGPFSQQIIGTIKVAQGGGKANTYMWDIHVQ